MENNEIAIIISFISDDSERIADDLPFNEQLVKPTYRREVAWDEFDWVGYEKIANALIRKMPLTEPLAKMFWDAVKNGKVLYFDDLILLIM